MSLTDTYHNYQTQQKFVLIRLIISVSTIYNKHVMTTLTKSSLILVTDRYFFSIK